MNKWMRYLGLMLLVSALTACGKKPTAFYYMSHPDALQKALLDCQGAINLLDKHQAHCHIVFEAAEKVAALLNEQRYNPEKFGERVLDAQTAYASQQATIRDLQQKLKELNASQAASDDIQSVQTKLLEARQTAREQRDEITVLLAVLGLGSPGG